MIRPFAVAAAIAAAPILLFFAYFAIPPSIDNCGSASAYANLRLVKAFEGEGVLRRKDAFACLGTVLAYLSESPNGCDGQMAFPSIELRIVQSANKHALHDAATNCRLLVESYKIANRFSEDELYAIYLNGLGLNEISSAWFHKRAIDLDESELLICYYKRITNGADVSAMRRYIVRRLGQAQYDHLVGLERKPQT